MDRKQDRYVDFRRLLTSAGFAATLVAAASYLLIPSAPLASIVGGVVGIPTGVSAGSARTPFRAMMRGAAMWSIILGVFAAFAYKRAVVGLLEFLLPYLAFMATVISIAALSAGCLPIFHRAVDPADGRPPRFQFTLAEALTLSFVFAIFLGSAFWWKQQAPELFRLLADPGIGTISSHR
jgi:hypothetical protein